MPPKKATPAAKKTTTRKRKPAQTSPVARTDVFISYSHHDKAWVEQLTSHLRPLERTSITVWVDTKLRSGDKWRAEIEKALAKTRVAILLISSRFLASDFIHTNELPPLLRAAADEGTAILPLLVSTSLFERTPLGEFQALNTTNQILDLLTEGQVNQVLAQVARQVDDIMNAPAAVKEKPARKAAAKKAVLPPPETPAPPISAAPAAKASRRGGAVAKAKTSPASTTATTQALLVRQNGEWEMLNVIQAIIGQQLVLSLKATTPTQTAFLTNLRQRRDELASVVYNLQTYPCKLRELSAVTEGKRETWQLTADWQPLGARTEVTYNGFTPDRQAQARAELLLLNSQSAEAGLTRWLSGGSWLSEISGSPLPALYQQVGKQPTRFRQVAPLVISWFLHFTGTVEHILRLKLTLQGAQLAVDFEGQRAALYQESPDLLHVKGICLLGGVGLAPLLLGPVRHY